MKHENIFADNVSSAILDTALLKLEDSQSVRQVEHRSGCCYGIAKALYEQNHITCSEYEAYQKQVLHIVRCFSDKFIKDEYEEVR